MSSVFDEAVLDDRPEIDLSVLASLRAEPEDKIVLALDVGTSGARAALFDARGDQIDGSLVTVHSNAYSSLVSGSDVNPDELVDLVVRTLDLAVERSQLFVSRIDFVAWACFWHSLLGVDDSGHALTPLLGWADTRAADSVRELRTQLDEETFHRRTGCRFHSSYWPAKLLWLRKSRPDAFVKVRRWLSFSDYLFLTLFGDARTSVSMASGTGLLNQTTCEWDRGLLAKLQVSEDRLPPIAGLGQTCGALRDDYKLRWPALDRASWFPAIGDGAANNLGTGCVSRERVALMLGTSGAMRMVSSRAAPTSLPSELFCYRADRDRVVIGGAVSDGGSLLSWVKKAFVLDYDAGEFNRLLEETEADSHGLTILPFWSGERATGWSNTAKGSIQGLSAATQPMQIARAVIESVSYRFALIARALDPFAPDASLMLTGKIFLSFPVWAQMMADVLGRRVELFPAPEATIRGAALLALETIGTIDTLEILKSEPGRTFVPDMQRHQVYTGAIRRQEELYKRLIA